MDIIFFAAIAFFIFVKLKSQLGKIDENEKEQIQDRIEKKRQLLESLQSQMLANQNQEKTVQENSKLQENANNISEELIASLDETAKNNFSQALKACKISAEFFLDGTKSAFEMVIKAFSEGDLETLKFLLSDTIYSGFAAAVNERKEKEHSLVSNLIAIEQAQITAASMENKLATITVQFQSQQINYVTNKEGEIIEGSREEIVTLTDSWTFRKDVTISNPNWTIVSTNS
jgi:predicted lipid-binding transport protein (Tim44 family)